MCVRTIFAAMLCVLSLSSRAEIIGDNDGGRIGTFADRYKALRDSGERVVIDGKCLSACTLVLGFVPRERICATEGAMFGFHAAWMPLNGKIVRSNEGTQLLWSMYPPEVKRFIGKVGLQEKMVFAKATRFVRLCAPSALSDAAHFSGQFGIPP